MSTSFTTSSTSEGGGLRNNKILQVKPLSRKRRMFSKRDSPIPVTPPRNIARATCGMPQVPLVTPKTSMPDSAHLCVIARVLASMMSKSTMT